MKGITLYMKIKKRILKFINKPQRNILSSQTLYECLLASLDLYEVTKDDYWMIQAKEITNLVKSIQLENGGFDIGYNFMFGNGLKKYSYKEATTPEVVSIYALYRFGELFGFDDIHKNIADGVKWIFSQVVKVCEDKYAIPYAPHTYRGVHITNGVSFTIGVLSYYLKYNSDDSHAEQIFNGLINFMYDELEEAKEGKYWPYFYKHGTPEELKLVNNKIDNYHIGQQLKYHCVAYRNFPNDKNLKIIKSVSTYLKSRINEEGILPYTENNLKVSDNIDIWGYSSVIKGLLDSFVVLGDNYLRDKAQKMMEFIILNSWNGRYFIPIVSTNKGYFDTNFYPRSDAWVLHTVSHYQKVNGYDKDLYKICTLDYEIIKKCNFRGLENHTLTTRKAISYKLLKLLISNRNRKENSIHK